MAGDALNGRRIIITGGASGMGAALVRAFTAEGAQSVSMDIDDENGERIARTASAAGPGRATYLRCDVSDKASVDEAFAKATEVLGRLDALTHAAGISPGAPAESIALADWERVFAINARGTFLTNQAAFPYLKDHGGRIVNFASGAGVQGQMNKAHYSATKGAVLSWTRTVAKEWGKYGITVNALAPAIKTPMYALTRSLMTPEVLVAHDAELKIRMPLGGALGDADRDFAPVLVFLVGEGSRFMTGQTIAIDGGMCMVR